MKNPPIEAKTVRQLLNWYMETYKLGEIVPGAIVRGTIIVALNRAVKMLIGNSF